MSRYGAGTPPEHRRNPQHGAKIAALSERQKFKKMSETNQQGVQIPSREQVDEQLKDMANEPTLFLNFSNEDFTGYWGGRGRTFKAGEKKFLPRYLAEHYALHLTNRELLKLGKETSTSPKNPSQVPEFMELFNKACIPQENASTDVVDSQIALMNEPSMNMPSSPAKVADKKPAITQDDDDASTELQTPTGDDEDDNFEQS